MSLGNSLKYTVGLDMSAAERGLKRFGDSASAVGARIGGLASAAARVGGTLAAAGLGLGAAVKSVTDVGAEMEAFQARLVVFMGSASEAKVRMAELFSFSASTPFELAEVVGAEVTLRGFGAAAEEVMPRLIDFSAAVGTDLAQSAVDFGKAWSQGGVGLESDSGKILKSMIEARTGISTADMAIEDFRKNMLDTLDARFAGGAGRLSKTFTGMVSNLADEWSRFKLEVSDAGLFNNVKGALETTLTLINANRGETKKWAGVVSADLWAAIKGAATGIAYAVDVVSALGAGFNRAKANAQELAAVTLAALALAGQALPGGTTATQAAVAHNRAMAQEMHASAAESRALADAVGEGGSALDRVASFFGAAEAAARGYGAAAEEAGRQTSGAGRAGAGGGSGGGPTAAQKERAAQLKEASAFQSEMRRMGETELEEAERLWSERTELADGYFANGLLGWEGYLASVEGANRAHDAVLNSIRDEAAERERERLAELAKQEEGYRQSQLQAASDLLGSLSALAGQASERMTEDQKEAAMSLWAVRLGAATAQVALDTIQGVSAAAASAPPPYNALPIAAALAQGALSEAAVLSTPAPTFSDTPGVQQMTGTGRGIASFAPGDFVAAARTPEDLRRQVGTSDPFARIAGITVIGSRPFGRFVRDDVALGATPLARLVNAGRNVGRRSRS